MTGSRKLVYLLLVAWVAAICPPVVADNGQFANASSAFWASTPHEAAIDGFFSTSGHTNNWAVLVCTSRFWFNYRHIANTLSVYRTVKRLGIPDSNIILMLADDVACNPRNRFPAAVYNKPGQMLDLYGENVEVDYRGYEVTVENFIRLLTGRLDPEVPRSKRLLTDDRSNILVYMTGHGGEEFLKFQDAEEISSHDVADAFAQMWEKKRYHEIFFVADTCQAASMYMRFSKERTPNVLAVASSQTGENSYSYDTDTELGVAIIDRFTYSNLQTLERLQRSDQWTLKSLFDSYDPRFMYSTPGIRTDLYDRSMEETLVTDFFGGVQNVELTQSGYGVKGAASSPGASTGPKQAERKRSKVSVSQNKLLPVESTQPVSFLFGVAVVAFVGITVVLYKNL